MLFGRPLGGVLGWEHGCFPAPPNTGIWGVLSAFGDFFPPLYRGKQDTVLLSPIGSFSSLIDQKLHSNYVLRTYVNYWFNFQTY